MIVQCQCPLKDHITMFLSGPGGIRPLVPDSPPAKRVVYPLDFH